MRLGFFRTKGDDEQPDHDEYRAEGYPGLHAEGDGKNKNILLRIALYGGLFVAFVVSVGGYYYLYFIRSSINKTISKQPPISMTVLDPEGGHGDPASKEVRLIQADSDQAKQLPEPPVSKQPAQSVSIAQGQKVNTNIVQGASERTSAAREAPSAARDEQRTLLDQLVLGEDNPFREKFLKKFQDSQTTGRSQRQGGRSTRPGYPSLSSLSAKRDRAGKDLTGNELNILPVIAGTQQNSQESLKIYGVIKAQDTSIVLTNKGELKVGSVIGGDLVTGITMNEVCLKSGKVLKIFAR